MPLLAVLLALLPRNTWALVCPPAPREPCTRAPNSLPTAALKSLRTQQPDKPADPSPNRSGAWKARCPWAGSSLGSGDNSISLHLQIPEATCFPWLLSSSWPLPPSSHLSDSESPPHKDPCDHWSHLHRVLAHLTVLGVTPLQSSIFRLSQEAQPQGVGTRTWWSSGGRRPTFPSPQPHPPLPDLLPSPPVSLPPTKQQPLYSKHIE